MTVPTEAGAALPPVGFDLFLEVWNRAVLGLSTPGHHIAIARWLERCVRTGERRLLLMAFRNAGKSTLVAQFCAWLLAGDPSRRLLVLSATDALATRLVLHTRDIVRRHPLTRALVPDRKAEWAADRFTVSRPVSWREPSMRAAGIGATITGARADVLICDDVEVPNTADTADKRAALRTRLTETAFVLNPGGLQLYVGTPHSWFSLYAAEPRREIGETRPFLDGYRRCVLPILDADGHSLWPQRFPQAAIDRIRRQGGPRAFAAQMLLQPTADRDGRLDPERLIRYAAEPAYREAHGRAVLDLDGRPLVSAACWWDPAFGSASGDGSVLAALYFTADGLSLLHRLVWLNAADERPVRADGEAEALRQCAAVARWVDRLHLPSVAVEINGIGRFLPGLLRRALDAQGLAVPVLEIANRRPKDARILEAWDARLAAGTLHAHDSVLGGPLVGEMRGWRPGGGGGDDGLDAVAGALSLEPVRLGRLSRTGRRPAWRPAAPTRARTSLT